MKIRHAIKKDFASLITIMNICFPPEEAVGEEAFAQRLDIYPDHFRLLEEGETILGFICGMVTDQERISDEMFENAHLHRADGQWQTIFGVNTLPEYRKQGHAARMMEQLLAAAKEEGRKGCILTCKETLVPYYEKLGFQNRGISQSAIAGLRWYDMSLEF